jgi:hypothetical protein
MKFIVELNGHRVILDAGRLEILASALNGSDYMHDHHVGTGNGTSGHAKSYIPVLKPYNLHENFALKVLDEEHYEAVKFITKQQDLS